MITTNAKDNPGENTTYKVVLPFYLYAALSFLLATILLFFSANAFTQHYFQPGILAITHIMALGWGTMMILGASYQLVPVLIEGRLYSNALAYASFALAAVGIALLVNGFYTFNMGWPAQWGAILINVAILCYLVNLAVSITKTKEENIHAIFIFTAACWLFFTTLIGLLLVYNFSINIFSEDSLHYLSLHAHMGIIGWFLLLVAGISSRLIPMFLISKYSNIKLLWVIYILINGGLITFIISFLYFPGTILKFIPVAAILLAVILLGYYCYRSYQQRIRRKVDEQMKISLFSIMLMALPVIVLMAVITGLMITSVNTRLVLVYGFVIFFGWITAMILGMTFKTLPFIIWNKVYHLQAGMGKTPNPKDLFSSRIFNAMAFVYLVGFLFFIVGIFLAKTSVLKLATIFLLLTALLYNWNVIKIFLHKPGKS